ncbi:hypothetical protein [Corynebacterium caspium]|uniref:hypothetical protein n=1 Tax=Corynebacterium caspium TaxID=234828 RepID=UPI000365CC6D|nr:hypothetical protein [Corynebacterium caspium]WKD59285.1 hypothetical protein CCASP_04445 [Corynebacterium caspium DSM 44850]
MKRGPRKYFPVLNNPLPAALSLMMALALTSCSGVESETLEIGGASPVLSPVQQQTPAGEVISLPAQFTQASQLKTENGFIVVRGETHLGVGTLAQWRAGAMELVDISTDCGDFDIQDSTVVVPCGPKLLSFKLEKPQEISEYLLGNPDGATAVAFLSTGEIAVANKQQKAIYIYSGLNDSITTSSPREITVEAGTDQLLASHITGGSDAVIRTRSVDSTVQGLDLTGMRQGPRLRVGLGFGTFAAGPEGLFLASDNRGEQLLLYTGEDVIRLHQSLKVAASPWAVAWDEHRKLAWIASTATNSVSGYTVSTGTPVLKENLPTIENVRAMDLLYTKDAAVSGTGESSLVLVSNSGAGMQIISIPST